MRERINRWLIATGECAVLLPLWRRFIHRRRGRVAAAIATGAVWIVVVAALLTAGGGDGDSDENGGGSAARASSPTPQRTARPSRTRAASPTPGATLTQTPQPTPTTDPTAATPVPAPGTEGTPRPPASASGLTIVSSSSYTDTSGTFHVAGEVRNSGPEYMELVEIIGTFFNGAGEVVTSDSNYTHADFVPPGEAAGFDLTVLDGGSLGISRYELTVAGEVTPDRPAPGLGVQGDSSNVDEYGDFHVVGQVVNQSAQPAEFIKIIGTFYAADGTVVRSDFTYTDVDVVAPGESAPFDLIVPEGGSAGIASYSLKVEGSQP